MNNSKAILVAMLLGGAIGSIVANVRRDCQVFADGPVLAPDFPYSRTDVALRLLPAIVESRQYITEEYPRKANPTGEDYVRAAYGIADDFIAAAKVGGPNLDEQKAMGQEAGK